MKSSQKGIVKIPHVHHWQPGLGTKLYEKCLYCPKIRAVPYHCKRCLDTKEIINDSCDHLGEHVQTITKCECTLK